MRYRTSLILFILAESCCLTGWQFGFLPQYGWIIPLVLFIGLLVCGSIFLQMNFYFNSQHHIESMDAGKPSIMLSFDDGIHPIYTPQILDILARDQVKAMFFLIGKNISGHEDIVRRMHAEGHVIGNHSFHHGFLFDLLPAKKMEAELMQTQQRIQQCGISATSYFRPPYGVSTPVLARVVKRCQLQPVGWNLRSLDTMARHPQSLLIRLQRLTQPGCIVLLHDRCAVTVEVLTGYIAFCKARGYTFTTLTQE